MSDYVVTRYYRAPEVILGLQYTEKVDIWSIGCIVAELVNRRVLFPGTDRLDQWTKIVEVMGTPGREFTSRLDPSAKLYVRSRPVRSPVAIEQILPDERFLADTERPPHLTGEERRVEQRSFAISAANARSFVQRMLVIDPEQRMSVDEALTHPYVAHWWTEAEVNAPPPVISYNDDVDNSDRTIAQWKGNGR